MNTDRPLDAIASIKVKLGLLVVASVLVALVVAVIGQQSGVSGWITAPVTVVAALGVTQWLARGMTAPLRQMTLAVTRMAGGDYDQRVTATSQDEVGQLAAAFNTMATDLGAADAQRRQLVATVSHELRTPLAAQRALLENLVDGVVQPDDAQLRTALTQAERLSDLVRDLLDLSRVDAGVSLLALRDVPVLAFLTDAVEEAQVGGRPVRFAVECRPTDLTVRADPARLNQLVANLLDNAARHSPVDGEVTLTAYRTPASDDGAVPTWVLEVRDEGPGIPPELAGEVFRRFGTGQDTSGGTGLGLAIAQWVAVLHGGTIHVVPQSSDTTGAQLRVVLPLTPSTLPKHPSMLKETVLSTPPPTPAAPTPPSPPTPPAGATAVPGTVVAVVPPVAPPSVTDSVFGGFWPERDPRPRTGALLAALGVGALAALTVVNHSVGVALFIVALAAGAVVHSVARHRTTPWSWFSLVLCVVLAATTIWRASEWISVLSLLIAGVVMTTALTDARRLSAMVLGLLSWPLSAIRGLPLLGRTLAATTKQRLLWPVLRTAALTLVALVLFGGLFASADAVFGSWAQAIIPDLAWDSIIARVFVFVAVSGLVLTACYLALNPPNVKETLGPTATPVARRWEWLTPVGVVVALFVGFLAAQASAMWGGHAYLQRTTGLTYAQYVHQGFGQLTVATFFTLIVVAVAVRKGPRGTAGDRLMVRGTLGMLCVLTLAVVASALYRMSLYQQAYGFTVLRLFVDAFEILLGVFVVLLFVAVVRLDWAWVARIGLVATAASMLVLAAMNPAAWVASHNLDRYAATGKLDTAYLSSLGPDATPTIAAKLPAEFASCVIGAQGRAGYDAIEDPLEWNLGRARAESTTVTLPSAAGIDCSPYVTDSYRD